MDDEATVPDDRRRASRRMSKVDPKARRKSTKSNLDVDEYLSRQVTKKKFSSGEEIKSPEKKHKVKRLKLAAARPPRSSLKLETSLPTQDISKAYYKEVEGDLAMACEILSDHEREIIWKSVDLIAAIPADYPPRRYINKLCCCDTCCMRCCDNADHKKTGFHNTLKSDASTDVPDNTELTMSGSDTSAISLLRSEQTLLDLAEFADESKPVAVRAVVAAREAKRAIQAAKDFRTASKTVQSLECSTDSELKIRRQYVKDLMERAVEEAKMARDALAKYRVLKKAARRNPGVIAQITRNEDVMSLESLLSQDAETRRCRFRAVTPDGRQAREARRYASTPNFITTDPSPYGRHLYDAPQAGLPPPGSYPSGPLPYYLPPPRLPSHGLPPYGTSDFGARVAFGTRYIGPPCIQPYDPLIGPPLSYRQPSPFSDPDYGGSRQRRTSAPEVLTRRDRSIPIKSTATLVRGADIAINKARQAAEEANKLQKISAAILSETRALKFPEQQSQCLTRQPFCVQNDFLSNSDMSNDERRYRNDSRSLYMSGQERPYDSRFAGAAQINSSVVDREVTAGMHQNSTPRFQGPPEGTTVEPDQKLYSGQGENYGLRMPAVASQSRINKSAIGSESRTPYFGTDRSVQPEVPFKVRSSRKASITASSAMAPQHEPSVQAMQSTSQIKPALKAPARKASMSAPTALQLQEKTSGKGQAKFSEQLPTTDSQPKFRSHVARRASVSAGLEFKVQTKPSDETSKISSQETLTAKITGKKGSVVSATALQENPTPKLFSSRRASVAPRQLLGDYTTETERRRLSTASRDLSAATEPAANLPSAAHGAGITPMTSSPTKNGPASALESVSHKVRPTRRASVSSKKISSPDDDGSDRLSKLEREGTNVVMGRQIVKITLPPITTAFKKVGTPVVSTRGRPCSPCSPRSPCWLSTFLGSRDTKQTQTYIDEGVVPQPRSTKGVEIVEDMSEQSLDIEITPSQKSKSTQKPSSRRDKSRSLKQTRSEKPSYKSKADSSSPIKKDLKKNDVVAKNIQWEPDTGTSEKCDDGLSMKSFEETPESKESLKNMLKRRESLDNRTKEEEGFNDIAGLAVTTTTHQPEAENIIPTKDAAVSLMGQPSQVKLVFHDNSGQAKPVENGSSQTKMSNVQSDKQTEEKKVHLYFNGGRPEKLVVEKPKPVKPTKSNKEREERLDAVSVASARRLSKMEAAGLPKVSSRAIAKYKTKKEAAAKKKAATQKKENHMETRTSIFERSTRSNTSTPSWGSTTSIEAEMQQENAAVGQLRIPEKPKVLPSETYVMAVSTTDAVSPGGDAAIPQRALNTGEPDGAKPPDEAYKEKRRHDNLIEEKPDLPNDSIMGGQDRQSLQLEAGLSARAFDDEKVSGEITKGHPVDIPGEAEGHLSGESAEQDKVDALKSVAKGAPEGGSLEVTQQTYSVDLDEKPEPAARKDINPAQQSFSQELPRHEVNDARAIQLESLPTPAPLRGPEAQDISFWDLRGPARLYPESRLILALSTAGALWVLFIMFTTPMDPNKHTLLEIAPKKMTVSPQHRFLADRDTSDTWAIGTTTNATEDTTVDTTVDTTMTDEATSPTYPRSFYACNTPYCEREASYLRSLLTGNPCSNFYSYACKLETNLWKPSLGSSVSRDTLLGDQAEKLITSYILDKSHHEMKVAKDLLKACTDRGDSDSWHRMEMNELFFEYFGSTWPVDDKPVTSEGVWAMAGRLVRDLKLEAFAAVSIDVHPENKAAHVIGIDEPNLLYREGDWTKPAYTELLTGAIEQSIMFMNADANVRLHISNIKQTMVLFAKLVAGPNVRYMGVENYRLSKVRLLASGVRAFLGAAFLDTVAVTGGTDIMVKSPLFFERLEHAESSEFSPTNLLNYLGFRVMVYFGTFLEQRLLRQLRAIEAGFSYQENTTLERFCTREVERILPAFYLRAYSLQMTKTSLLPKSWTSKLERTFIQQLQRVAWARDPRGTTAPSDSDVRMAKYKILSHTIQPFTPAWVLRNASFLEYHRGLLHHLEVSLSLDPTNVLKRIILFVRLVQRERLREPWAVNNTTTSSVFDSEARYDVQRKNVHVPMAIINASVPANSTAFVVHISRYGVRIFKALIPALYQEYVYEANQHDQGPLLYTDGYQERLRDTVSCLLGQYKLLAGQLKSTFLKGIPDLTSAGLAILEQTLALQQAYWTFQEFLNIKRVWRS
ncbi:unnamed protein product, partial [Ixodes pacificus]